MKTFSRVKRSCGHFTDFREKAVTVTDERYEWFLGIPCEICRMPSHNYEPNAHQQVLRRAAHISEGVVLSDEYYLVKEG